jgi:hypothetical protein
VTADKRNKMNKYTIQSNIPIPSIRGRQRDPESFSGKLRSLKIGQSIYIKKVKVNSVSQTANRVLGTGNYTSRTLNGGVRVWRIK